MSKTDTIALLIVTAVIIQRLYELVLANKNTQALLSQGAFETGQKHYPLIVLLHAGWISSILIWIIMGYASLNGVFLGLYVLLQPLRLWVLKTLGKYWTTRVIIVPGRDLIKTGPYRWFKHPNYMTVICEIAILPLAFGAIEIAVIFSILNAIILSHRIKVENASLNSHKPSV